MVRHPEHKKLVSRLLCDVIQRADEITEFLAIYWKDGKTPIAAQVKKGLAAAFRKFDEFQLARYNRDGAIKLRDVLFLCHSKPIDAQGMNKLARAQLKKDQQSTTKFVDHRLNEHEELYRKLVDNELATPDTWETQLSAGASKLDTFIRLMQEKKLGALAFLRNLRNMTEAGIDTKTLADYGMQVNVERVLPFRFLSAARIVPQLEPMLEAMMFRCLDGMDKLPGKTVVLVDVSASMNNALSSKSDMKRVDAAYGLAVLVRELCDDAHIWSFSQDAVKVAPRRGFALRDAIHTSQLHSATYLGRSIDTIHRIEHGYDRIIVITDEQSADRPAAPLKGAKGYVINIASHKNGVGYGPWTHIDGWSEAVVDFIQRYEALEEVKEVA